MRHKSRTKNYLSGIVFYGTLACGVAAEGAAMGLLVDIVRNLTYELKESETVIEALDNHTLNSSRNSNSYLFTIIGSALGATVGIAMGCKGVREFNRINQPSRETF